MPELRNKFAGTCVICGKRCAPGDGTPMKRDGGKWRVQHIKCGAVQEGEGAAVAAKLAPAKPTHYDFTRRRRSNFVGIDPR